MDLSYLLARKPDPAKEDPQMRAILDRVTGMTTPSIMSLLNTACQMLSPDECYCEVGTYRGATLLGAMHGIAGRGWHAIDDFSEFRGDPGVLLENLRDTGLAAGIGLHLAPFERVLLSRDPFMKQRVGVFFYDGAHDYRSTLLALLLILPFLAHEALIVLDDTNMPMVRQAVHDWANIVQDVRLVLDERTPQNGHPTWWNGVMVWHRQAGKVWGHKIEADAAVVKRLYDIRD